MRAEGEARVNWKLHGFNLTRAATTIQDGAHKPLERGGAGWGWACGNTSHVFQVEPDGSSSKVSVLKFYDSFEPRGKRL